MGIAVASGVGTVPMQQAKLVAPDATDFSDFGYSVGLAGDTAVVGAPRNGNNAGAAYVFTRTGTTWTQEAELASLGAVDGSGFGQSVAAAGDTVVVGRPGASPPAGAAYVFRRQGTTWVQEAKLTAGDATDNYFGVPVAVGGDTVVVGATAHHLTDAGAAYVFTRTGTTWTQEAKLAAADAEPDTEYTDFGWAVAVSGNTAVVGADYDGRYRGAAYVFARTGTTWTQEAKLTAADATDYDRFGASVAVTGDTVVVGRYGGSAYVFTRTGTTWTQEAMLAGFGPAVAVAGDTAVVRAGDHAANLFTRKGTAWTQKATLVPADGTSTDYFGSSVAVDGDTALVGAFNTARGAAYVFVPPPVEVPAGYVLPTKVTAKANAKSPERSTLTASGTLDTGSGPADFSGAATFDAGGFHLDVPAFAAKGKALTYSAGGVTLTITPARNGSSRSAFSAKAVGDLTGKVVRDGPLTVRFANATHDLSGSVVLTKGVLGPHCVTAPDLCVSAATATVKGAGKDTFALTVGFAGTGAVPEAAEDLTIGFGGAYTSPVLSGATFVRKRNAYVFTAKAPGITKATVDYAKGTITIAGSRLDLGAFDAGGNPVVVTLTRGSETLSATIRMSRAGTKLTY